jgi:hypothetical protein
MEIESLQKVKNSILQNFNTQETTSDQPTKSDSNNTYNPI